MQSRIHNFSFATNYNFGVDNVFVLQSVEEGAPFPPAEGNFLLLQGSDFLLLNGGDLLLL